MDRKSLMKKLLFLPLWLLLLLTAVSAAGLGYVFIKDMSEDMRAIPVYALSFYTLCVLCAYCGIVLPKEYRRIRARLQAHPLGRRYLTEAEFRSRVSLYASLGISLLYVGTNVLSWFLYRSMWFVVLAVYYVILALMRFLLLRYVRLNSAGKSRLAELRTAGASMWVLLLINFVLTGAVMMILYQNRGFEYHGVLIYVMALYTFYSTTHAIVDLIKYRKYKSPVMTAGKIIALAAALVSMLALETAMFSQFGGEMDVENQRLMIALTGAGVSAAVIAMAVCMLVKIMKEIREIKINGREN